jgi:hypothetical protein
MDFGAMNFTLGGLTSHDRLQQAVSLETRRCKKSSVPLAFMVEMKAGVTNSSFTPSAIALAQKANIKLFDGTFLRTKSFS